jgi:hypothetical protein
MALHDRVTDNVRLIAAARDTTPAAIAGRLGKSRQWISAKMTGAVRWGIDDVELVARELDVEPERLISASWLPQELLVRPKGLEPPTFWTVLCTLLTWWFGFARVSRRALTVDDVALAA